MNSCYSDYDCSMIAKNNIKYYNITTIIMFLNLKKTLEGKHHVYIKQFVWCHFHCQDWGYRNIINCYVNESSFVYFSNVGVSSTCEDSKVNYGTTLSTTEAVP